MDRTGLLPLSAAAIPPGLQAPLRCPVDAAARTARQLGMLAELAEIGMDLARALHRQVIAAEPDSVQPDASGAMRVGDAGLVFARIARAVRQTAALEARLDAEADGLSRRRQAEDSARRENEAARAAAAGRDRAERRRGEVRRVVERLIEAERGLRDADNMLCDLEERLDDHDDAEFGDAPIGEMVARICAGLRLSPDWSRWAAAPWAADAASVVAAEGVAVGGVGGSARFAVGAGCAKGAGSADRAGSALGWVFLGALG